MPFQGLPWTEFISCPVCFKLFNERQQRPISLGCGHTVCKSCIRSRLNDNRCPFDQTLLPNDVDKLPANFALMHLVGAAVPEQEKEAIKTVSDNPKSYEQARKCIEEMAVHLKPLAENASDDDSSTCSDMNPSKSTTSSSNNNSINNTTSKCVLSRPMQRKLISLIHCQLLEEEGRSRAARIARSLGERIVSELLVLHQYPHQLSANLWAAVRTRGCQFLGPAMQEEVLKLILLALEDGSFLSRKVLVLFVVQRLESRYPQASKTAIGHVVQLLYRASCFKVLKREEESSLMQLKEEFRQYESLRREHDSQIVQIAIEAGLRISPEQWSSLLYGDPAHKSHMQSIIDKHQSPQSFAQSITELILTLQRSGDHSGLQKLQPQLEFLSNIDPSPDCPAPSWENLEAIMRSLNTVMMTFVEFLSNPDHRSRLEAAPVQNTRYKTSMCRDFSARGTCPRGNTCTFAHSQEELERYRSRSRRNGGRGIAGVPEKTSSSLTPSESDQLRQVQLTSKLKVENVMKNGAMKPPMGNGKTHSVVELMDPKLAAGSPNELSPLLKKLALNQQGLLSSNMLPVGIQQHEMRLNTQTLDPEKAPFIPPAPTNIPATHLTFSRPTFDVQDGSAGPPVGQQVCCHPHNPTTFPPMQSMRPQSPYPMNGGMPAFTGVLPGGAPIRPPINMNTPCQMMRGASPNIMPPQTVVAGEGMQELEQQSTSVCMPAAPAAQGTEGPVVGLVPYSIETHSLADLTTRKQDIINHLQEEPMFMESSSPIYQADSIRAGFAGLKTVLGNNKKTTDAMPKLVSDMFVATRSTQSLDDYLFDDSLLYTMKWSDGDDQSMGTTSNSNGVKCSTMEQSSRCSLPSSITTSSVSVATSNCCSRENGYTYDLFSNGSRKSDTSGVEQATSNENDAEFSSFPSDDSDETFIPFEHTCVSKYGPISRLNRMKNNNTSPVQVTADTCKRMTPVLAITPMDRPLSTSMPVSSKFTPSSLAENLCAEPPVKPTPSEIPSIWQQSPQPSYQNIALLKAGAADAVSNNERLAYELQAIELEISMKTGRVPEPVGKIIQDAVMGSWQAPPRSSNASVYNHKSPSVDMLSIMSHGHMTACLRNIETGKNSVSPQVAAQQFMEEYYRSSQGLKK